MISNGGKQEWSKSRKKINLVENNITFSIDLVVKAFLNLFPSNERKIIINPDPTLAKKQNKKIPLGFTDFPSSKKDPIVIQISAHIGLSEMLDILAHELAHIGRGEEFSIKNPHDRKWKKIYSQIHKEYMRLLRNYK